MIHPQFTNGTALSQSGDIFLTTLILLPTGLCVIGLIGLSCDIWLDNQIVKENDRYIINFDFDTRVIGYESVKDIADEYRRIVETETDFEVGNEEYQEGLI